MANMFSQRIDCWRNTKSICNLINKPPPDSIKLQYSNTPLIKRHERSNITIHNMDTIDCSYQYNNTLVLNLADDLFPGGCVDSGSGAQEESLFRRTNYYQTLKISMYPIKSTEAIYSPQVSVIKSSENDGWKLYSKKQKVNFIACPALKYPQIIQKSGVKPRLTDSDVQLLKRKIELIIQTAFKYKHDCIIFGAMGCGAWQNPPHHVAEIFKEVLQEYDGVIKDYVFAILKTNDDSTVKLHKLNSNYDIFVDVFKKI